MSLFVCATCKTIENTALCNYWYAGKGQPKTCSECGLGKWHGRFPKEKFDPDKWEPDYGDFIKKI